jgi:outer membrane receptor protein involved in Fe transport
MPTPAYAQASTAAINGRVLDSSGGVVPEAEVALRRVDTSVVRRTRTNPSGNYVLLNVLPGSYTLEISKTGFQRSQLTAFRLAVNQTATFDVSLQVGAVEQSVTVESTGAEVQGATAELGAAITSRQVVDLPLNGRNFTQLLALTPGVSPVSVASNSGGADARPIGTFTFPSVNGQSNRSNFFMLDGSNNQGSFFGTYNVQPIVDAIQEFKVQSHNDSAEFGQVMGGVVNVVTKSGTNQLHGSLWEYLRNDAFDARGYFLPRVSPFKQNQFGASGGGPVILPRVYDGRNRTFFFLAYQGFRYRNPASTFYRVPTAANYQGDMSDWPRAIYNPFTTRTDPNKPGAFLREPFSGNQIPASLLDKGMLTFARETLQTPVVTGVADRNAFDSTPGRRNAEEYSMRFDQNLGTKDFLWFRYSGLLQDMNSSAGRQKFRTVEDFQARNLSASWVHTFGPTSTLQVQVGRARTHMNYQFDFVDVPSTLRTDAGFSDNFTANFAGGKTLIPNVNVPGFFSGGQGGAEKWPTMVWNEKANFAKVHGSHIFKTGVELSSNAYREVGLSASVGFQTTQTSDPQNQGTTGSPLASFFLGVPDSGMRKNLINSTRWGGVLGLYFQDQWKVTPRLTLNLGLRYDRTFTPPYGRVEDNNTAIGGLDLNRGVYVLQTVPPSCATSGKAPCIPTPDGKLPANVVGAPNGRLFQDTKDNWQPRIGLAYRIRPRTALRASFGIVFDNWAGVLQYISNAEGTWPSLGSLNASNLNFPTAAQPTPTLKAANPVPSGIYPAATPFEQVSFNRDPYAKNPYSLQYNFGIQHQLDSATVLTLNYVGSGSRRLDLGGFYNVALTPGPGDPRQRSLYPYIRPTRYQTSWGRSSYQAFQVLYDRKLSRGFAHVVSYTWSKAIDAGCSGWFGVEGCSIQNPYKFNDERSVSAFDLTHTLAVNWVYELPVGPGKRFNTGQRVADFILGNWQINGIATIRSGAPFNLSVPGDIANTGNSGYMRPNLIGDPRISEPKPTPGLWFNPAAFASPAPYTFGNFGRNRLRADYFRNFDMSVFRQFRISESKRVEFRAEAFNTFNTPTFGAPTGSISSVNFGKVLGTANSPRQLQLGLKILF